MEDLTKYLARRSSEFDDIQEYIDYLYELFCEDWIDDPPYYMGREVEFTGVKKTNCKEATFWKLIGTDTDKLYGHRSPNVRAPHFDRAEKIRWAKQIIESFPDPDIRHWIEIHPEGPRHHLWYKNDYIVVIGVNGRERILVTALYVLPKNIAYYEKQYEKYKKDAAVTTS